MHARTHACLYAYACMHVVVHDSVCMYVRTYIGMYYIYGTPPPPPQRSMFLLFVQLFSHANISSRSFSHSLTHIFFIITAGRSILKYWATLSFNMADPRSKIQDCTGLLGRYLGSGRSILKYWATLSFNMADPRSKIQDCTGLLGRNLGSWILYIDIQYGLNISI